MNRPCAAWQRRRSRLCAEERRFPAFYKQEHDRKKDGEKAASRLFDAGVCRPFSARRVEEKAAMKKQSRRKYHPPQKPHSKIDLIGRTLEVPSAAILRDAKTELIGNREATVDGCRCVAAYSDTKITLNIGRGCISFLGSGLEISSLSGNVAVISGLIATVEFSL